MRLRPAFLSYSARTGMQSIGRGFRRSAARRFGGKWGVTTARDEAAFMAPASVRYGREIGVMMLVFIVGWAYSLVAPLVTVIAAIYFMSSWVVWRWQIIYVYVRCYEGGGQMWRSVVACMMFSMLIFSFFLTCVFVAKRAFYQAALCFVFLPLIIVVTWCAPSRHCSAGLSELRVRALSCTATRAPACACS